MDFWKLEFENTITMSGAKGIGKNESKTVLMWMCQMQEALKVIELPIYMRLQ